MPSRLQRCILAAILVLVPPATAFAQDQTFRAMLGGRTLGTLEYSGDRLTTVLDNTPLGVADGVFEGRSRRARTEAGQSVTHYTGNSRSARESRSISVLHDKGRVLQTEVSPESERTPLSAAAAVPPGVIDPVQGFGRMAGAATCPTTFRMYDGRRVIRVSPNGSVDDENRHICHMRYEVIAGPGHLSPFRFTSLDLDLTYGIQAGGFSHLAAMEIRAGPFRLRLIR